MLPWEREKVEAYYISGTSIVIFLHLQHVKVKKKKKRKDKHGVMCMYCKDAQKKIIYLYLQISNTLESNPNPIIKPVGHWWH